MIHLIKLAVGISDVPHLEAVQRDHATARGDLKVRRVFTRNTPVRPDAAEGSLFWVIKGVIRCRQRVLGFEKEIDEHGRAYCLIVLAADLVPVAPMRRAAFQGWRYLDPTAAPPDLSPGVDGEPPPDEMLAELRELGLI